MNYEKPKKRRSCLLVLAILIPFLIVFAVLAAISLNMVKDGKPGLLSKETEVALTEKPYEIDPSIDRQVPDDVKTYVLLGSDYRPESGYRTDVILLVAVNFNKSEMHLLSFPRDLWVTIPGFGEQRINTVQPYGGFELLADTLLVNFGFKPDHYAMVDFEGFKHIIDLLGGIDVKVTQPMQDQCEFNPERWCVVEPGEVYMDSDYALWYVRARYNTSDFDRTRRAQEVIQAIAKKAISFNSLSNSSQLIGAFEETIETDLALNDLSPLLFRFGKLTDENAVTTYSIGQNETTGWITDGGADVLLPNYDAISVIINQVLWIDNP